jgi:DNA replication protein DnaC
MKCYAEHYCKKDRSNCSDVCGGYRVLRALYTLSQIPERYKYYIPLVPEKKDIPAFEELNDFMKEVKAHVEAGDGLYIWGNAGNGKTSWACKIMGYYFRKIAFSSGLENEGLYIYLPTFLENLRAYYDTKDPEFEKVLEMVTGCKLLIIDDIGAERMSEWVNERLLSFITERVNNQLSTIFTSNISPEALRERVEGRLASRVLGYSKVVHITGDDRRGA